MRKSDRVPRRGSATSGATGFRMHGMRVRQYQHRFAADRKSSACRVSGIVQSPSLDQSKIEGAGGSDVQHSPGSRNASEAGRPVSAPCQWHEEDCGTGAARSDRQRLRANSGRTAETETSSRIDAQKRTGGGKGLPPCNGGARTQRVEHMKRRLSLSDLRSKKRRSRTAGSRETTRSRLERYSARVRRRSNSKMQRTGS